MGLRPNYLLDLGRYIGNLRRHQLFGVGLIIAGADFRPLHRSVSKLRGVRAVLKPLPLLRTV